MSTTGKISYLVAGLCLVILAITHYILGIWIPFLYVPLVICVGAIAVALIADRRLYLEFLTLRTTRHGMNMGAMILLVIALLVCVNYFAVEDNKTFDFTAAHLNSLSKQTTKILSQMDGDVSIKVFYKGPEGEEMRKKIQHVLDMYQENSSKVKVRYINAYIDNIDAQKYLNQLADKERTLAFAFVDYKGKRIRIESGFGEEQITAALIKATRKVEKKIYFVIGHGERSLTGTDPEGLSDFSQSLKESSFQTETLNLTEKTAVPKDAAFVAIIGPNSEFLEPELGILRDYARKGGRLLIALDPGEKHHLAGLVKTFGGQFENDYLITFNPLVGRGEAAAIGATFDTTSEITKPFIDGQSRLLFDMASEVKVASDKPASIQAHELVKTSPNSFAMPELKHVTSVQNQGVHTVAIQLSGTLPRVDGSDSSKDKKVDAYANAKNFAAVIVGDSDFMANKTVEVGLNKDFAMNIVAYLANESDLVSIRPREAKGDHLTLTANAKLGVVAAGVSLPVILLILSGVVWFRRRGA